MVVFLPPVVWVMIRYRYVYHKKTGFFTQSFKEKLVDKNSPYL